MSALLTSSSMSRSSSSTDVEAIASARKAKRRRIENVPEGLDDTRISHLGPLLPPCCLLEQLPLTNAIAEVVHEGRAQVSRIINGKAIAWSALWARAVCTISKLPKSTHWYVPSTFVCDFVCCCCFFCFFESNVYSTCSI